MREAVAYDAGTLRSRGSALPWDSPRGLKDAAQGVDINRGRRLRLGNVSADRAHQALWTLRLPLISVESLLEGPFGLLVVPLVRRFKIGWEPDEARGWLLAVRHALAARQVAFVQQEDGSVALEAHALETAAAREGPAHSNSN